MRYIFDFDIDDISVNDFNAYISSELIPQKNRILEYLRSFSPIAYSSAPIEDKLDGKQTNYTDNIRQDGIFQWSESEIYHFEKYNLKINDDFVQYVLNQAK